MAIDDIIQRKILAEGEYYNKQIQNSIGQDIDMNVISEISSLFFQEKNYILSLAHARNINPDFISLSEMFKLKMMFTIYGTYKFDKEENPELIFDDKYKNRLLEETYRGLLISDFDNINNNSSFLSNPAIALPIFLFNLIKILDLNKIKDPIKRDVYKREIDNLIDSMLSMFSLLNNKCYSQAMSVFRQALEIFITIRTIDMYPNSLQSFVDHQIVTIEDALEIMGKKKLDEYINSNGLTYNNYKSYLNYGWLDSIDRFKEMKDSNPKIKYSIKTTAEISDSMEFYDAMNFASNYVHSNFVFVDINWNIVISEVLDGTYQILDWLLFMYLDLDKKSFVINDIDYMELYSNEKDRILNVIKKNSYEF